MRCLPVPIKLGCGSPQIQSTQTTNHRSDGRALVVLRLQRLRRLPAMQSSKARFASQYRAKQD
jgi:hypothetical protein